MKTKINKPIAQLILYPDIVGVCLNSLVGAVPCQFTWKYYLLLIVGIHDLVKNEGNVFVLGTESILTLPIVMTRMLFLMH